MLFRIPVFIVLLCISLCAQSDTLNIAVASNFSATLKQLAERFESRTGHKINIISGSTGKLYSQIMYGAPFDLFLAADAARPEKLVSDGRASPDYVRVYALGDLIFISNLSAVQCSDVLWDPALKKLAIANPDTAPYGLAAKQVLTSLGLWEALKNRLVMGENITQTLQFISTGNADAGFVARSTVLQQKEIHYACQWDTPDSLHNPIRQKMALLNTSKNKHVAKLFWQTMFTDETRRLITQNGYQLPD